MAQSQDTNILIETTIEDLLQQIITKIDARIKV